MSVRSTGELSLPTLILRGLDSSPVHERIRSASSNESGRRTTVQNLLGDITALTPARCMRNFCSGSPRFLGHEVHLFRPVILHGSRQGKAARPSRSTNPPRPPRSYSTNSPPPLAQSHAP